MHTFESANGSYKYIRNDINTNGRKMHLFLQSNACVERFPGNHSSHFKIFLPETLQFPNHEVCLERVYYNKEFSSIDSMPIEITFNEDSTFKDLCHFDMASEVPSGEEFATQFLDRIKYDNEVNKQIVCFERGPASNIVAFSNRSAYSVRVQIPSNIINAYNLKVRLNADIVPLFNNMSVPGKSQVHFWAHILYPVSVKVNGKVRIKSSLADDVMIKVNLPKGYYETGRAFVEAFNDVIWKNALLEHPMTPERDEGPFVFSETLNRCQYKPISDCISINMGPAAYTLGFKKTVFEESPITAGGRVDFTAGIQTMYIYSDIVNSAIVGDVKVPLLAVVPFSRKVHGEREFYEFVNPPYMPVVQHPFNTLELQLCDDVGNTLKRVLLGKTLVCLNIREVTINKDLCPKCRQSADDNAVNSDWWRTASVLRGPIPEGKRPL